MSLSVGIGVLPGSFVHSTYLGKYDKLTALECLPIGRGPASLQYPTDRDHRIEGPAIQVPCLEGYLQHSIVVSAGPQEQHQILSAC